MTKAFDLSDLQSRLVKIGLPEAEKLAKDIVDTVLFGWLNDSLVLEATTQPIYAVGVAVLPAVKSAIDQALAQALPAAPAAIVVNVNV